MVLPFFTPMTFAMCSDITMPSSSGYARLPSSLYSLVREASGEMAWMVQSVFPPGPDRVTANSIIPSVISTCGCFTASRASSKRTGCSN